MKIIFTEYFWLRQLIISFVLIFFFRFYLTDMGIKTRTLLLGKFSLDFLVFLVLPRCFYPLNPSQFYPVYIWSTAPTPLRILINTYIHLSPDYNVPFYSSQDKYTLTLLYEKRKNSEKHTIHQSYLRSQLR